MARKRSGNPRAQQLYQQRLGQTQNKGGGRRSPNRKQAIKKLLGNSGKPKGFVQKTEPRPVMGVNTGSEVQGYGGATRHRIASSGSADNDRQWVTKQAKMVPIKKMPKKYKKHPKMKIAQ